MRFILMARVVLAVFTVAFGPFLYHGRLLAKMTGQVCLFHLLTDDMFFFYFSKAWRNPQPKKIARLIAYAYTCGFLFGWHVHEKASLHFVIPLAIVSLDSMDDARHCFLLAAVSYYSLLSLLFEAQEYPVKVTLLLLHCILMWSGFSTFFPDAASPSSDEHSHKKDDNQRSDESLTLLFNNGRFDIGWIEKNY